MKMRPFKFALATLVFYLVSIAWPGSSYADPRAESETFLTSGKHTETVCRFTDESVEKAAWALSVTASAEARGEGLLGMALTIEIMINRMCVDEERYGGASAKGVVTYPFAFSVYNRDSSVRSELLMLIANEKLDGNIPEHAKRIYPIALAMLDGWRTGLLPLNNACRHYKTQEAKARWAKSKPDLIYRGHEFYCGVDR